MTLERVDIENCGDQFAVTLHRNIYDFVLTKLMPCQHVLEIGTGLGTFTKELLPICGSYAGIEYDHDTCLKAQRKNVPRHISSRCRRLAFWRQSIFFYCLLGSTDILEIGNRA